MTSGPLLPGQAPIIRRIALGVSRAVAKGYQPKALYLVPGDRRELLLAARDAGVADLPRKFGGLELRDSRAQHSRIYCARGASVPVPRRPPP